MMTWSKKPLHGPVTSLAFTGEKLIAGIGSYLHVYDYNHSSFSRKILNHERIHALLTLHRDATKIETFACIGLKTFRTVDVSKNGEILRLSKLWKFQDRILDVKTLNQTEFAILFGFNNIVRFSVERGEVGKIQCDDCCILYSGKILCSSWSETVVFAGSVFNEILVWTTDDQIVKAPVLHTLKGHDGVIFAIDYLEEKRLLCSASDDRSIRLWSLQSEKTNIYDAIRHGVIQLNTIMYGHTARIWDVKIRSDLLVSIGEDATCFEWNLDGSIRRTVKFQNVKSIRALALDCNMDRVATAGEDGGIHVYFRNKEQSVSSCSISLPESKDFPREIKLLNHDTMVVFTDQGRLYTHTAKKWTLLLQDDNFRGYCAMDIHRTHSLVCIGSKNGVVKLGDLTTSVFNDVKIHEQKLTPLYLIQIQDELILATTSREESDFNLLLYVIDKQNLNLSHFKSFPLLGSRHTCINAIVYHHSSQCLVTGDKEGFVNFYNLNTSRVQNLKSHRKGGSSTFILRDDEILSGGRDGVMNVFRCEGAEFHNVSSNKPLRNIEWINTLSIHDNEMFMSGYKSTVFQFWNVGEQQKVCELNCGGGHRLNDLFIDDTIGVFIYVRSSDIISNRFDLHSEQSILRQPIHGKEITSVSYVTSRIENGETKHYFLSASEDTSLKLLSIDESNSLTVLSTIHSHISAVKSIDIVSNGVERLIFSCGGRGQLNVEKLSFFNSDITSQHINSNFCENSDVDIRYMYVKAFSAKNLNPDHDDKIHFIIVACSDGRLRLLMLSKVVKLIALSQEESGCIMDLALIFVSSRPIVIACSTSGQILFYDIHKLVKTAYLTLNDRDQKLDFKLQEFSCNFHYQLHRAGISCMSVTESRFGFALATGGEDNTLIVTRFSLNLVLNELLVSVFDSVCCDKAHASTITSVKWLEDTVLVSVASDQRVCLWQVHHQARAPSVELTQIIVSDVSDLLTCCTWTLNGNSYALVGGIGLQMLTFND